MQLTPDTLLKKLRHQWLPVLLISGDEPFQIDESACNFDKVAREYGFTECVSLQVDQYFHWNTFVENTQSRSLFTQRKIIKLHIASGKPGIAGSPSLIAYADNPNHDVALLIITPKLNRETLAAKWYKCIDAVGYVLKVWPISVDQMPRWVAQQAHRYQLRLTPNAIALLTERGEGNLFAAAQEIMKASLFYADQKTNVPIDAQMLAANVENSAHYSSFDLIDCIIDGNAKRCLCILDGLYEDGEQPLVILNTLTFVLRNLAEIAERVAVGQALSTACRDKSAMFQRRRSALQRALSRCQPDQWTRALVVASDIDRLIKHAPRRTDPPFRQCITDAWEGLKQLIILLCDHTLPGPFILRFSSRKGCTKKEVIVVQ